MRQPKFKTAPPLSSDQQSLKDYSSIVQTNMNQLFQLAHNHPIFTSAPVTNQGDDGDVVLVNLSGTTYLYAKFPTLGWVRVLLS